MSYVHRPILMTSAGSVVSGHHQGVRSWRRSAPGRRKRHRRRGRLLIEQSGSCEIAISTLGDHGQQQTIDPVFTPLYADGDDIQAAIEAPRIRHYGGDVVMVEDRVPEEWIAEIEAKGYAARRIGAWSRLAGGVNAIQRRPGRLMLAGADPRRASYTLTAYSC